MSNEAFKHNFAALLAKAGEKAELVVRKTALELQSQMIQASPVDTGRFRANWQCGIGAVNQTTTNRAGKVGYAALGRTSEALQGWKPGQTIYLTNSLPYAKRLENGWSKQAPAGIVALTVQNYANTLEKVVRSMK